MENRGIIKSEIRSDGKLAIHITEGDIWMTRHEIREFLGVFIQSVNANLREIFKSGELYENEVVKEITKGEYIISYYNLDVVFALTYRCKGGYCTSIRKWITERIKKPIVEHRQPIIIALGKGGTIS